jgi:hypothetical protein
MQASPCGNVNIASTIDSSTAVTAAADGTFAATGVDFNAYVTYHAPHIYQS